MKKCRHPLRAADQRKNVMLILAFAGSPFCARAGDLNPPPGPIMPTNRVQLNRQAISLPYTISEPGSYVLTSNLTGVAGGHGIVIAANDVTLDLNGFSLIGVPGSLRGIHFAQTLRNIEIRNGVVRGWGEFGIAIVVHNGTFTDLRISENGTSTDYDGMKLSGSNNHVVDCISQRNAGHGFHVGPESLIQRCVANENGFSGITLSGSGTVEDCVVARNKMAGVRIDGSGSMISGIVATGNDGPGIHVISGNGNRLDGNNVSGNASGIRVDSAGNLVTRNSANNNGADYVIGAGNAYGPIVNVIGVGDISAIPHADHSWANFSF